jgi:hypothetical protein
MAIRGRRAPRFRRAPGFGPLGLVALLYSAAALVSAWPGLASFGSAYLAGGAEGYGETAPGDHGQVVYRFWLLGHQLAAWHAPWRDPYSFQPLVEPQAALGGWPFGLPFWPLEAVFGPVLAWNLLLLATVVAGGLLAYAWLRALDLGFVPALVGGLAFAIAPYRLAQSADHLLGWIAIFLPLSLLAVERARAAPTRRSAHAWGALAAVALVSFPLSGQLHLALGVLPFVAAYAAVRFHPLPAMWIAGGVVASAAAGLALRYTVVEGSRLADRRSLSSVDAYSAEALDFLNRFHTAPSEELVYLGWLTLMLAVAGLAVLLQARRGLGILLGLALLVPVLIAFGTNLPLYAPLRSVVPPLQSARVPGRFMPIADLALAALAAFALAALLERVPRRSALVGVAAFLLVAADLTVMPFAPTPADRSNEAYAAARRSPPGRILEVPTFDPGRQEGSVYDLYTLQARREKPTGYSTLAPEAAFDFYYRFGRVSCGVWLDGDRDRLDALGVEQVLFHRGLFRSGVPGGWFAWRGVLAAGYRPVARDGAVTLLGPNGRADLSNPFGEPAREEPYFCRGWIDRRTSEPQAPFWVWGQGVLTLDFVAPRPTTATLWLDGHRERRFAIAKTDTIRVPLTGEHWHPLLVEIPGIYETDPPYGLRLTRISFPWH